MDVSDAYKSIEKVSRSDLSAPGRLAVRSELRRLESLIDPDEIVVSMARGAYKGRFGLVVVTKKRVIFVDRAKIHSQTVSFSLTRISKIETGSTPMGYGRIRLFLVTDEPAPDQLSFKVVPKTKTEELAQAISIYSKVRDVNDVGILPDESIELAASEKADTEPDTSAPGFGDLSST